MLSPHSSLWKNIMLAKFNTSAAWPINSQAVSHSVSALFPRCFTAAGRTSNRMHCSAEAAWTLILQQSGPITILQEACHLASAEGRGAGKEHWWRQVRSGDFPGEDKHQSTEGPWPPAGKIRTLPYFQQIREVSVLLPQLKGEHADSPWPFISGIRESEVILGRPCNRFRRLTVAEPWGCGLLILGTW